MDRILKNFWVYGGGNPVNRYTWSCPELVGRYKMKILMMSMGSNPNTAYQLTINSPQIISNNSTVDYWVYNPYGFAIDFTNFVNVGYCNYQMNRYICGDLTADVLMNGQFDYQHAVFNTAWNQSGKTALAFDYITNRKLVITAEFIKIKEEVPRPLSSQKRFLLNISTPPDDYTNIVAKANFSVFDPRLIGKFRCRLIFTTCITGFPMNVGAYLISPQFDLNVPYYFSIGEAQRRDSYGYCPNDYVGTFYGNFNYTTYSNRTRAEQDIYMSCFIWEFTEI